MKPAGHAVGVAIGAASVSLASIPLPWITAGIGSEAITYSGFQLPPAAAPVTIAALATVALAVGTLGVSTALAPYAVLASVLGALFAAATIMVTETVALLVPASLLPETVNRTMFSLGAGYGIWLALGGLAIAAVAMHGGLSRSITHRLRLSGEQWKHMLALLGLAMLTVLIGWLRYRTWIDASMFERHLGLPAWAAPWIGPLSLLAVWMMVGALLLAIFHSARIAGLLAAAAGWLISLLAALVVLAVGSFGRLGLENLLPSSADGYVPGFHTTGFVWIAFSAGLVAAGIGAFLVHFHDRAEGAKQWRS